MEFLTFLAAIAIIVILLLNNSKVSKKLNTLFREIEQLKEVISGIQKTGISQTSETKKPAVEKTSGSERIPAPVKEEPKPAISSIETFTSSYEDTIKAKMEAMAFEHVPAQQKTIKKEIPVATQRPKKSTDFEKFIGENLISKLGIIILVLGIGFFVKYAIDQNWIGVYGRTAIGLLTGAILVSLAHYLRKSFVTFSSLLTGGGFAVFYLTIAIAFHQYHIFSQTAAFIIMVLITIFSVLLSLAYDRKELAIFSQLGGYAAPFMLSTGAGNYIVLFSYLLILNGGLLVLAYYKRWHILNLLAFIFTLIIFSGWLATFWGTTKLPHLNAMLFATAFYMVFFLVNILNNIKERTPFKTAEIMMILSNNLFFFLWGITILYTFENGIYRGLFTVLAGLFNFGWVLYLYHKKQVDKNLIYLLIALVMSYISLAVPIQLNGHSITLFWTAELVILLWLSQISGIKIMKTGHLIILALVIISIAMDLGSLYNKKDLPIIFNQAFVTGLFVIAGLGISAMLMRREKEPDFVKNLISTSAYKNVLSLLLFLTVFIVPFTELIYQVGRFYSQSSMKVIYGAIYIYAYLFIALYITKAPNRKPAFNSIFIISWVSLLLYLLIFHLNVLDLRFGLIYLKNVSTGNFVIHYLAIPFVAGMIYIMNKNRSYLLKEKTLFSQVFRWFISFLLVFIASAELDNILVLLSKGENYNQILEMSHKVGYPILWGICAFILFTLGIKLEEKLFRIQALCLIALILLKLFVFDVWNMSEGGRIAAFVFLGIVLLVVSFLYQKLKNLILDQDSNSENSAL